MLQITRFLINYCKEFMILARNGFFLFTYNSKYNKKPDSNLSGFEEHIITYSKSLSVCTLCL